MHCENIIGGFMLAAGFILASGADAGDAAAGKAIFDKTCNGCHSREAGVNKQGPSLYGVVGRKAGTAEGFAYSDAMKNSGKTWTEDELDIYLSNPRGTLHGVNMYFRGLKTESERADVISYLEQQK